MLELEFRNGSAYISEDYTTIIEFPKCDNIFAVLNRLRKVTDKTHHWKLVGGSYERQIKKREKK